MSVAKQPETRIHPTAEVSPEARIGAGCRIWHDVQIREGVHIGENCIVGKGAYIDFGVRIGNAVKIQNRASVYHGTTLEDGVFIGPHVIFTNDLRPRAITPDGKLKTTDDWIVGQTVVRYGASIGAGSVILPGLEIGRFALVGAGSVVTKSVPEHGIVVGNPGRLMGHACICAGKLEIREGRASCPVCQRQYRVVSAGGDPVQLAIEES